MTGTKKDLIDYRYSRALDTFDDARILAQNKKWNSTINRLYYAAYYAVTALLLKSDINPATHNGAKINFSKHYIKTGKISPKLGKTYSQLFTWRQKGDYDDLFDFDKKIVLPYFEPLEKLIKEIEKFLKE